MAARKKTVDDQQKPRAFSGHIRPTEPVSAAKSKGDSADQIVQEREREVVRAGKKLQVRLARRRAVRTR